MPLPASGAISLDDIQTEFGGTNPISLSEYYRGGGLVPDTATNAAVPTSGAISLGNFYGASAVIPVSASPTTVSNNFVNSPASMLPANRTLTTGSTTASGGNGTYSWAYLSGDASVTANTSSSATTSFNATVGVGTSKSAVFRVTSDGTTADVNVNFSYDSGF